MRVLYMKLQKDGYNNMQNIIQNLVTLINSKCINEPKGSKS
jgi:hypothetical protein